MLSEAFQALARGDVSLADRPRILTRDDYEAAIRKVVGHLSSFPEVEAVYQVGGVSNPGISDIDLLVVFRDGSRPPRVSYRRLLNDVESYAFMHGLFGMPASLFRRRAWLIPIYEERLLHGRDIPPTEKLTAQERTALHQLYALEYLILNLANLAVQTVHKRLKMRSLLCSLRAMSLDFAILRGGTLSPEEKDFARRIAEFRAACQERGAAGRDEFLRLCLLAARLAQAAIDDFVRRLSRSEQPEISEEPRTLHVAVNCFLRPSDREDKFRMSIRRTWMDGFLERLASGMRSGVPAGHLRDLRLGFFSVEVRVPKALFCLMAGKSGEPWDSVYRRRAALLQDYEKYMRGAVREWTLFDIFRWHPRQSLKWSFIRRMARILFGRGETVED